MPEVSMDELNQWLHRTPVVADVHPLVPLCLKPGTQIVSDTLLMRRLIDAPFHHVSEPILILSKDPVLREIFPHLSVSAQPSAEAINYNLADNLQYARSYLLTSESIAEQIEIDVSRKHYQTVVVLCVDGLSYADVVDWTCDLKPCFVYGPSITYRYEDHTQRNPIPSIGFPAIIGNPTIYSRLYRQGYRNARGYTYWNSDNAVADHMFRGIPYQRVANFETVLGYLESEEDLEHTYVQVVREGLDGLAHSKRELRRQEIDASVVGIKHDIERLLFLLSGRNLSACVFVVADHGILWKTEHAFRILRDAVTSHARYHVEVPGQTICDNHVVPIEKNGVVYHLLKYPFLGRAIKANDSGVHGGLSYQESIVPFAKFEVRPQWN